MRYYVLALAEPRGPWNWWMMFLQPRQSPNSVTALIDLLGGRSVGVFEEVNDATTVDR